MKKVVRKKLLKWLEAWIIYPISDNEWVSQTQRLNSGRKGKKNELISTRTVSGWCVCIDYRKLNDATEKDHFSLPFIDQILDRLAEISIIISLMGIQDTIKFISIQMIKRRLCSPIHKEHILFKGCRSDYEGIVLKYQISNRGLKVNKAKIEIIEKLTYQQTFETSQNLKTLESTASEGHTFRLQR
ncbi:Retrovirus-related Pol polyprotein from transposon opus [Gossypium australe]|uniref:Retrovirus-related Pol polyprotein from transposon opus n=1 Tax=Gossypium australe TaxID=47621 RepID=A0A5B6VZC8_9ROSI|nr:Retrovirus-related Pol polyprotein from transposon opus [Gossypium australe]